MNYPYGPYGQGFPGPGQPQPGQPQPPGYPQQPAFGQQPSYPQQFGYPGAPQPYTLPPTAPQSPSGVTGIIAGLLAGLGGLVNFFSGLVMAFGLGVISHQSTPDIGPMPSDGVWAGLIAVTTLTIIAGLLLLLGSVPLLLRKVVGRGLVAVACTVSIVSSLIGFALPATVGSYQYGGAAAHAVGLIFPIATLVLSFLPSTTKWIRAKQHSAAPQFYPPYPG